MGEHSATEGNLAEIEAQTAKPKLSVIEGLGAARVPKVHTKMTTQSMDLRKSVGPVIEPHGPVTQNFYVYSTVEASVLLGQIRRVDQPKVYDGRQPYRGLAPFAEEDAGFFFGREKLVEELLERVKAARFVCIAGPSGSGKSSLAEAGLIHALKAGRLEGSEKWLYATLTPRGDPVEQLALAMARMAKDPDKADYLHQRGTTDPAALHDQVEALLTHQPQQRAVVYVDQFEEIFTQTKAEEARRAFLDLLTTAAQRQDGRVIVLISVRTDFLSQCATYPTLRALISQQFQLVGAMAPDELAKAIALPALEVGAEIEPELVAQVIADMRGEPGALPLMQFALKDLFDWLQPKPGQVVRMTKTDYLARGGIGEALERHANAAFDRLAPAQQQIARGIFGRLIDVGRGTLDTRRTVAFSELVPIGHDPGPVAEVVAALADARLVTTAGETPEDQAPPEPFDDRTVTLAHEKLIDAWPWLRRLVDENREAIARQNEIGDDAAEWLRHDRDESYLYAGARLATAREGLAEGKIILGNPAAEFVQAAADRAEAERLAEIRTPTACAASIGSWLWPLGSRSWRLSWLGSSWPRPKKKPAVLGPASWRPARNGSWRNR